MRGTGSTLGHERAERLTKHVNYCSMPVTYSCASFALETTGVQKEKKKAINTRRKKKIKHTGRC